MPEKHKTLPFNGRTLHYRVEGRDNTQTVVLLHGFLQNLSVWSALSLRLMHFFRVVCIDLPGHGYSDSYNNDCHSMDFISRCINEVLITEGITDCVIIGHSWGGYAALAYAENFEYNVKGIGLLHSVAMPDSEEKKQQRLKVCQEVRKHRPNFVLEFIPSLFAQCNQAVLSHEIEEIKEQALDITTEAIIAAQMGMMRRSSSIYFLSRTTVPVMFIYGKQDNRIPLEVATAMATVPAYSQLLLLDNVAHMSHLENPSAVTRWIANFVMTCYNKNGACDNLTLIG